MGCQFCGRPSVVEVTRRLQGDTIPVCERCWAAAEEAEQVYLTPARKVEVETEGGER